MKRPISERLQLVSLPECGGFLPTPAEGLDPNLRIGDRQKYIASLNKESSFWPAGCVEASCPHPLLITDNHQETFEKLVEALDLAIQDIVERWWTDEEAGFPLRMPLEPREESLLRVSTLSKARRQIWADTLTISRFTKVDRRQSRYLSPL